MRWRTPRLPLLLALLLVAAPGIAVPAEGEPPAAVAVVVASTGENLRLGPDSAEPLQRFDWLAADDRVRVAEGGSLTLAFADGGRVRLGGGAAARLAVGGLEEASGPLEELDPVPTLPPLAAASTGNELARPAAMRLRGQRSPALFPDVGARAPADETVLRFDAVPGAETYRVEVEDEDGEVIFRAETGETEVEVPADVLAPDGIYWWSLRSEDSSGRSVGGWWAQLETLSAEDARARRELVAALGDTPDPSARALLAEVDCRLGLHVRCLRGLEALLESGDGDGDGLRRRIEHLRSALGE